MKRITLVLTLMLWAVLGFSFAVAQTYGGSGDLV